jgi:hypothetical protein
LLPGHLDHSRWSAAAAYHLNRKQVPAGYFSVMSEPFVVAGAFLEREGYVLPRRGAQGQNVSPDVGVSRTFRVAADGRRRLLARTSLHQTLARPYQSFLVASRALVPQDVLAP